MWGFCGSQGRCRTVSKSKKQLPKGFKQNLFMYLFIQHFIKFCLPTVERMKWKDGWRDWGKQERDDGGLNQSGSRRDRQNWTIKIRVQFQKFFQTEKRVTSLREGSLAEKYFALLEHNKDKKLTKGICSCLEATCLSWKDLRFTVQLELS